MSRPGSEISFGLQGKRQRDEEWSKQKKKVFNDQKSETQLAEAGLKKNQKTTNYE